MGYVIIPEFVTLVDDLVRIVQVELPARRIAGEIAFVELVDVDPVASAEQIVEDLVMVTVVQLEVKPAVNGGMRTHFLADVGVKG